MNFAKFLRAPFFTEYLWAASEHRVTQRKSLRKIFEKLDLLQSWKRSVSCKKTCISSHSQMFYKKSILNPFSNFITSLGNSLTAVSFFTNCVNTVQIWSYFWSVFYCIQSEYRKIRTRNNSVFGHFHVVGQLKTKKILCKKRIRCGCFSVTCRKKIKSNLFTVTA